MSDLLMAGSYPLFDKIINLTLVQKDGSERYIKCPSFGQKPSINIQGTMNPACVIQDCDVRITNLLTGDTPLTAYKYLKIEAGYSGQQRATIECEVNNAYQETPGPDGITIFKSFLGYWTNWANATMSQQWTTGTNVSTVLDFCATQLGLTLKSSLSNDVQIQAPSGWGFTGLVKDFLTDIAKVLNVNIYPSGPFLIAFPIGGNTQARHVLQYFTTPPRHEAYGYNLTCPWDPTVRPGDVITVNTRYMRQTYGGSVVDATGTSFVVRTLAYDFSTNDDTNSMIIMATEAAA